MTTMKDLPRYLYIEEGQFLSVKSSKDVQHSPDILHLLFAQQPDGSWREFSGKDLVELRERFPKFIKSVPPIDSESED